MSIKENQEKNSTFCQWCGRIVYQNVKTWRIGCRNTKCRFYLKGSKNLEKKFKTFQKIDYAKN